MKHYDHHASIPLPPDYPEQPSSPYPEQPQVPESNPLQEPWSDPEYPTRVGVPPHPDPRHPTELPMQLDFSPIMIE